VRIHRKIKDSMIERFDLEGEPIGEPYRKIKDSMVYTSDPVTLEVPITPGNEVELLRAALDAATDSGTEEILASGSIDDLPCCCACGGFELEEPTERDHNARRIRIRGPLELSQRKRGTCADLSVYNAAMKNAKHHLGRSKNTAMVELQPHARGPGRHHAVVRASCGMVSDPSIPREPGKGCPTCS